MQKMIPYEKLSKKEKRALSAKQRKDWGAISPVTRKSVSPKAYDRNKARKWRDESSASVPCDF